MHDGDGIGDLCENCLTAPNPDQSDRDRDGLGDVCDSCPFDSILTDTDLDGIDDGCDNCPVEANADGKLVGLASP